MIGYLDKRQTEEFFIEPEVDGELRFARTGDLGMYDKDGKLYYVDRLKEIIKSVLLTNLAYFRFHFMELLPF